MPEIKISNKLVLYLEAIEFMEKRVDSIIKQEASDLLWFLEHEHVYTAGSSAKSEHLIDTKSIPVYQSSRGGQYTYHGPGQRVVYLMLDLNKLFSPKSPDIHKFVTMLEIWLINCLSNLGIKGEIIPGNVGIWVRSARYNGEYAKIASIGIRVRKWVAYHGIAINISPDLSYFKGIVPCGIANRPVTSLLEEGIKIDMGELDKLLQESFRVNFSYF